MSESSEYWRGRKLATSEAITIVREVENELGLDSRKNPTRRIVRKLAKAFRQEHDAHMRADKR